MSRLGLFGGTFDPLHLGHLIIAQAICENTPLDRVCFIPSACPPHKGDDVMFTANLRYRMTSAALEGYAAFDISDCEMKREGPSFTVDTLRYFRSHYPGDDLYFIVGKDNLTEIQTWREPEKIIEMCTILVADRAGCPDVTVPAWLEGHVAFVSTPIIEISSTEIRARLRERKTIAHLVPEAVRLLIES